MPFSNRPFLFWDQFNLVFRLFRTSLDSWEIFSKLVWSRKISLFRQKKKILLGNLLPRVLFLYIRPKSRLKNRVTIVHLLQCKTNLFICLCFWGRNLRELKNIHLGKPPLISKNFFLIRSHQSTFIYTRLHSSRLIYNRLDESSDSSTFVYIRLDSSSDSSSLVYICLVTRLHSPTFVYTRLDSCKFV